MGTRAPINQGLVRGAWRGASFPRGKKRADEMTSDRDDCPAVRFATQPQSRNELIILRKRRPRKSSCPTISETDGVKEKRILINDLDVGGGRPKEQVTRGREKKRVMRRTWPGVQPSLWHQRHTRKPDVSGTTDWARRLPGDSDAAAACPGQHGVGDDTTKAKGRRRTVFRGHMDTASRSASASQRARPS